MALDTIIYCILSALGGAGIAAAIVYREMALKVARMRREGYILDAVVPEQKNEDEFWLDIPEG